MQYTITLSGAPIGTSDFTPSGEFVAVALAPLAGYNSIRMVVRAGSAAPCGAP